MDLGSLALGIVSCTLAIVVLLFTLRTNSWACRDRREREYLLRPWSFPVTHPNCLIVTMETRADLPILKLHDASMRSYCSRHGDCQYLFIPSWDSELPVYWHKFEIMIHYLQKFHQVLWMDSDAIISQQSMPISCLREESSGDKPIVLASDNTWWGLLKSMFFTNINTGVILSNQGGVQVFKKCLRQFREDKYCRTDGKPALRGLYGRRCYEQGVLSRRSFFKYIHIVGPHLIHNAHTCPTYPVYICHLFGQQKNIKCLSSIPRHEVSSA
jgi:hypothetical protein